MTDLQTIYNTALPRKLKPAFEHGIDIRPLAFLLDMIARLLTLSHARSDAFRRDDVGETLRGWRRQIEARYARAKLHNFKARLKAAMLACPESRARVAGELGGAAALNMWEARFATYQRKASEPRPRGVYTRPNLEALARGTGVKLRVDTEVPTNVTGIFRLMPIPRALPERPLMTDYQIEEQRLARGLRREARQQIWEALPPEEKFTRPYVDRREFLYDNCPPEEWVFNIRPIPVLPEELRGEVFDALQEVEAEKACDPDPDKALEPDSPAHKALNIREVSGPTREVAVGDPPGD